MAEATVEQGGGQLAQTGRGTLFWQLIRFGVTGGLASAVHVGVFYALMEWAGVFYLLATVIGFLVGFVVSFTLQKYWTFRDHSSAGVRGQALKYLIAQLIALAANVVLLSSFVELAGLGKLVAQIVTLGLVAAAMFFVSKFMIFRTAVSA